MRRRTIVLLLFAALLTACAKRETPVEAGVRTQTILVGNGAEPVSLDPNLAAQYAYMLWPIRNAKAFNTGAVADFGAVGVKVIDPTTLRLTLAQPTPYLPAIAAHMTWMPVHRATVEHHGATDDRLNAWAKPGRLVGNGAFTLAEWRPNDRVVVRRNPQYWDAAHTRLAAVVFLPTEDSAAEERNFRAGQAHVTSTLSPTHIAHYRATAPQLLRCDPFACTWFVRFNTVRPPFNQQRIRQAFALAINRQELVDRVTFGSRQPADSLVPPVLFRVPPTPPAPPDFEAARRLLAESGHAGGRGLPSVELLIQNGTELMKAAELLQETWRRELGVNVTIAAKESKTAWQCQQLLDFDIALAGWTADFADPANFLEIFLSDGSNSWTGWKSAEYDRLVAGSSAIPDPAQRFAQLRRAEEILLREAVIAPLYDDAQIYLLHPAVKGWIPAPLLFHRLNRVRLEP